MVISSPIPQTTHNITAVNGSKNAPACTLKSPAEIQLYQSRLAESGKIRCTPGFESIMPLEPAPCSAAAPVSCSCGQCPSIPNSNAKLSTTLSPTPIQIGQCEFCFSHRAPPNPATTAPISGSNGINQENLTARFDSICRSGCAGHC